MLMAADCSNKDNEFYNDVFVNSPNLAQIETQPAYVVGDAIMVNTDNFSRSIAEAGQLNDIDVYRTTGGARSFMFSYLLERQSGDAWQTVNIADADVISDLGNSVAYGDFLFAQSVFDDELQSYEYRGGIRLNSAGSYRMRFTYNESPSAAVVFVSDSFAENLFVTVFSLCSEVSSDGYYYFDVL